MRINREGRKTAVQFLNGVAIATLVTGVVGPLAAGTATAATVSAAFLVALALHGLALFVSSHG